MKRNSNRINLLAIMLLFMASIVWGQGQPQTKAIPEDPTVPHFITLNKKGEGILFGEVTGINMHIDTISRVDLPHGTHIKLTAIPEKGWSLVRIVKKEEVGKNIKESVLPLKGSFVDYPDTSAFPLSLEYNTTVNAYFEKIPTDTVVVSEKDTIISGDSIRLGNLIITGTSGNDATTVTLKDVTIQNSEKTATTSVTGGSNVILKLDGTVNLDNLVNRGNLIIRNSENNGMLNYNSVENNGKLTDETGMITSVTGSAALEIIPLEDQTVTEGSSVTLTAKATTSDIYHLTFLWERLQGTEWVQAAKPEVYKSEVVTRSLRSESSITSALEVSSSQAGNYRCTITNQVKEISTTLCTFAEVTSKSDPGTDPDPDPIPDPDPDPDPTPMPDPDPDPTPMPDPDPEQPTSITKVSDNALRIWNTKGNLHIYSPKVQTAYIVTMGGQLYQSLNIPEGETIIPLPQGVYIIRIDGQTSKICL